MKKSYSYILGLALCSILMFSCTKEDSNSIASETQVTFEQMLESVEASDSFSELDYQKIESEIRPCIY